MDERLKRRVVGAAVLVVAAVLFVPMLLYQADEAPEQPFRRTPSASTQPRLPAPVPPPEDTKVRVVPLDRTAPAAAVAASPPKPKPAKAVKPAPAREKAPAKVATAAAPPGKSGFVVQLGSFSKASNAVGLRDKLKAKGYKAFVKTSGSITRVYVGPQQNRAEAEKALKKLLADTKMKGIVVNFSG
jgi:DedD protein